MGQTLRADVRGHGALGGIDSSHRPAAAAWAARVAATMRLARRRG